MTDWSEEDEPNDEGHITNMLDFYSGDKCNETNKTYE